MPNKVIVKIKSVNNERQSGDSNMEIFCDDLVKLPLQPNGKKEISEANKVLITKEKFSEDNGTVIIGVVNDRYLNLDIFKSDLVESIEESTSSQSALLKNTNTAVESMIGSSNIKKEIDEVKLYEYNNSVILLKQFDEKNKLIEYFDLGSKFNFQIDVSSLIKGD